MSAVVNNATDPVTVDYNKRMASITRQVRDTVSVIPKYTPDYPLLIGKPIWVFVYGTLKRGYKNSKLLNDARRIGVDCVTAESNYHMYLSKGSGFPYVKKSKSTLMGVSPKRIRGELYQVPLDTLCQLDFLEGNGRHFFRKKTSVIWNYSDIPIRTKSDPPLPIEDMEHVRTHEVFMYEQVGPMPSDTEFKGKNPDYIALGLNGVGRIANDDSYQFCYTDQQR